MKIARLINSILAFTPFVMLSLVWHMLPYVIPVHFGLTGDVTRFGSRYEAFIPSIFALILFLALSNLEKRVFGKNENGKGKRDAVLLLVTCFMLLIFINFMLMNTFLIAFADIDSSVSNIFDSEIFVSVLLSILLMIVGLLFPRFKQNTIVGIRTKWTLNNEYIWNKTHKGGSKIFFVCGLFSYVICMFIVNPPLTFWASTAFVTISVAFSIIYSYIIYISTK